METTEPIEQQLQTEFDAWAKAGRGKGMEKGHWPTASQILAQFDLHDRMTFLDLGCGNGYAVGWASQHVGTQGKAVGLDISPEMITQAHTEFSGPNTQFVVGNAEDIPFGSNSFDAILAVESIYYYPDMLKALTEILRVLKPHGRFAAMVDFYEENPYSACWKDLLTIPVSYLSESAYKTLFEQAGFTHVRTERLFNPNPVDEATFEPGWGYNTVADKKRFRQEIGSLAIWGQKADA